MKRPMGNAVWTLMLCLGIALPVAFTGRGPPRRAIAGRAVDSHDSIDTARAIDQRFETAYQSRGIVPLPTAEERVVLRRLALALEGRIPSLEELRALESWPAGERLDRAADSLLSERRFADYFAERLARAFVPSLPTENFIIYRRNRLVVWLADRILAGESYGSIVRALVADHGLWTDHPATNFITSHDSDATKLATRTTRAFLGLRLDCAQCHDHPFRSWKQEDFRGFAAFFGQVQVGLFGVADRSAVTEPRMEDAIRSAVPCVPFAPEVFEAGTRRDQLAAWITSPDNPYFAKAIANRVWRLLFGRGLVEPIDDLENPEAVPGVLDLLAEDFKSHGEDLRRLVKVMARTAAFRRQSEFQAAATPDMPAVFAAFPSTRLLAPQVAGSLMQVSSLRTASARDHWLFRLIDFANQNDFMDDFGDRPDEELDERAGSLRQRLVLLNGRIVEERLKPGLFNATSRLAALAPTDIACVRLAFWVCLTRDPSPDENEYFSDRLSGTSGKTREREVEDLFWELVNSTEFSWNH